jgi:hypothetical protein
MTRNDLANAITEYSHTLTSKIVGTTGGFAALSQTGIGGLVGDAIDWFSTWPWMSTLSYVAIILLIIERSFIVWAYYKKHKRGEL